MAESPVFAGDSRFVVHPFSRQESGEEIIIGHLDAGVFLALPHEAVQVLDDLSAGKTMAETSELYTQRYGEIPDLEDFLQLMVQKGFVHPQSEGDDATAASAVSQAPGRKYHFSNVSERLAKSLFGGPALCLYGLVIAAGIWVAFQDPSIVPGRKALYFKHLHTLKILGVATFSLVTLLIHEMSHLLAARAVGVKSRMGIGHRLWVVVAETDLTGLWSVPKKERFLPILAGPLADMTSAALILLVIYGQHQGWIPVPPLALEMIRAIFFSYVLQITWQLFFFVRTDLYYVFSTYFDCKNLLGDTEVFLKNRLAGLVPAIRVTDQSHIPAKERRVIRFYSAVWLFGRTVALFLLFSVTIPLTLSYVHKIWSALQGGYGANGAAYLDALTSVVLSTALFGIGMGLWIRSLVRQWKPRALMKQASS
jgi:putative peptide zinc metalloprotease protein